MSYQVLARKWRPSKFSELVGQQHVKSALINGLDQQRLHHAYLFTGTRGVGKTTIARIFAKSLNCEVGVSAEPCGQCSTCLDVDQGRFVDLIEIDAASRTKVGDTREILDNVQYAPTKGRYKVYLIDEVHMLSRHSFNALLKTLEEPPEHVKFLLATTDPQKLPVTILSRCLQFNLQALTQQQIGEQLAHILSAEQIPFESNAVELIAKYAKGSMRDGLSLTDQAIAQSAQNIQLGVVQQMLGTVDVSWSQNIFSAVLRADAEQLLSELQRLALQHPDIGSVLDDLLTICHQIALTQVMPAAAKLNENNSEFIQSVAAQVAPEAIQVYYQLLLQGKKDIQLAPDLLSGFEMICLRLLAFTPVEAEQIASTSVKKNSEIALPNNELTTHALPEPEPIQELEAQQEFIHQLAQSQGFQGEASIASNTSNDQQPQTQQAPPALTEAPYQSAQPEVTTNEQVTQQFSEPDSEPASEQNIETASREAPATKPTETTEQFNAPHATNSADLAQIDNPVLAILAAREQQTAVVPEQENIEEAAVEVAEELTPEVEIEPEPELKALEDEQVRYAHEVDQWASLIERSGLMGLTRQLALQSAPDINGNHIELTVKKDFAHLLNDKTEAELYDVVSRMAPDCHFVINKSEIAEYSPASIQQNINENRQERAERSINEDEFVQTLLNEFDGKVIPDSVKPL